MNRQTFFSRLCMNFTMSMIAISILGSLIGDMGKNISALFLLGTQGLTFVSMGEIMLLSMMITCFDQFLFHSTYMQKHRFLIKIVWMFLLSGITTALFILGFQWFPSDVIEAWFGFVICFLICFVMTVGILYGKTKHDEKKYNAHLKDAQRKDVL